MRDDQPTTISYTVPNEKIVSQFAVIYPLAGEAGYSVHLRFRDGEERDIEVPDLERLQPLLFLLRSFSEVQFDPETQSLGFGPEKPGEASRDRSS